VQDLSVKVVSIYLLYRIIYWNVERQRNGSPHVHEYEFHRGLVFPVCYLLLQDPSVSQSQAIRC